MIVVAGVGVVDAENQLQVVVAGHDHVCHFEVFEYGRHHAGYAGFLLRQEAGQIYQYGFALHRIVEEAYQTLRMRLSIA